MIVIKHKTKKQDGIYFIGQNAIDVTGSCTLVKFNGKQILLECGLYQDNDYLTSYHINTKKFPFKPSEIDYVFIGHAHVDHIGNLPRLVKEGFKGRIITSPETKLIMKPLLLNCAYILQNECNILTRKYKHFYSPPYFEEDVYDVLKLIDEYKEVGRVFSLDDVVSFKWYENGHCIGARQLQLILRNEQGVATSILYTSDLGRLRAVNHYVTDTALSDEFNKIVIMESTYGELGRENKKTREFDEEKLKAAVYTVTERGGTVIMPCFSFSRTQEVLTVLYHLLYNEEFKYDVIVDSLLSCDISSLYSSLLSGEGLEEWKRVCEWENVRFIKDKEESLACVKDHTSKIVLSSSGFCTNGRVVSYLREYLKDSNSMVIFTGYTGADNSYLSYRIKNYKENKRLKINGEEIENRADCISLSTFSSHANREELLEYGSKLNTEKLLLVHGSVVAKNSLKESLIPLISKENRSYKVLAATKDMVVHL